MRAGQFFAGERCVPPCDQARGRAEANSRAPGPRFTARSAGERRRQIGRAAGRVEYIMEYMYMNPENWGKTQAGELFSDPEEGVGPMSSEPFAALRCAPPAVRWR